MPSNNPKSPLLALFEALRAVNDNVLALADNLAETHALIVSMEKALTIDAAPIASDATAIKKREAKTDKSI